MDSMNQIFGVALAVPSKGEKESSNASPSISIAPNAVKNTKSDSSPIVNNDIDSVTPMASLASYVMARFQENESFRRTSGVTDKLTYRIMAQKCAFTDRQKEILASKFSPEVAEKLFVPITSTKIRAARAMLIDLANQSGDPLFRIEPSPKPTVPKAIAASVNDKLILELTALFSKFEQMGLKEVPPEFMAKLTTLIKDRAFEQYDEIQNAEDTFARIRADRMQRAVWDLMVEGGWKKAFTEYIDYICTYGTGIIIGPIVKNVAQNECTTDKNGIVKYDRVIKSIPTFEAVNPFDCYPAPDAKDIEDGALCIRVKYTADELSRYAQSSSNVKAGNGWNIDDVKEILYRHPRGGVRLSIGTFDYERRYCENNGFEDVADCTFEGIRCFAMVRGSELIDIGITKTREHNVKKMKIDSDSFYRTETVVIDNRVVFCRIYSDAEELPISKGVFYTLPDSWWGEAIADKVAMAQCVLNNCITSLMSNMPASSGAIFWVNDIQRLANKSPNALKLKAGMTVPFLSGSMGNTGAPIGLLSVPSNATELLNVFQRMQTQADLDSGLPAYTEGQSAGQSGALRTASGLSIFTEASTRGLKMVMTTTDQCVISRTARLTADWILLNSDDMDLKGDVSIVPVGLIGKIMKAQRDQSRLQLFQMVLNSQLLNNIVGVNGLISLFRPSLKDLDINPDDVLPSKSKIEELELIQGIQQVYQATQAAQSVRDGATADVQKGGVPGVETPQVPQQQGGVAERRSVA